ncbi:MAG: BsaWI family type II restriction enzyme [Aestuariivirga sp.]
MNLKEFCNETYSAEYKQSLEAQNKKKKNGETAAQKFAIGATFIAAAIHFPDDNPAVIWDFIAAAHILRKSGVNADPATIEKVISAHQSWNKSSGHAFEEVLCKKLNESAIDTPIEFLLQRDLSTRIDKGLVSNEGPDIKWLRDNIKESWFDLYALVNNNDRSFVFGCIQSKTSIRDRVTRDREPSLRAMEQFFWSVAVVLNGDFLKLPKFQDMVNGGVTQEGNGWHAMYCLSDIPAEQRIVCVGSNFGLVVGHAEAAAKKWINQRQWLNKDWNV